MHALALLPLCAGLGAPPAPQEAFTDTYSLRPLLIGQDGGMVFQGLPRHRSEYFEEVTDRSNLGRVLAGDVQEVMFLLFELFADPGSPDTFLTLTGDERLVVRGSQVFHDRVAEALAGLERVVGHRSRLELTVLGGEVGAFAGLPPQATLAPGETGVWTQRAARVDRYAIELRVGATGVIDQSGARPLLLDYETEIASGSGVFDPALVLLRDGTRVAARYVPRGEGGRLSLIYDRSEVLGEPEVVPFRTTAAVTSGDGEGGVTQQVNVLELEQVDTVTRGVAVELDLGAGRVAAARIGWQVGDAAGDELLLARVRHEPLAPVEVVPVGEAALVLVDREAIEGSYTFVQRPARAYLLGHVDATSRRALELAIQRPAPSLEFELLPRVPGGWRTLGSWLVAALPSVREAQGVVDGIEPLLLEPAPARRVSATARVAGADAPLVDFELPASIDGQSFAFAVRTSPRVVDFDVEVATNSSLGDPNVAELERGAAIGLVPRVEGGATALGVRAEVQALRGAARTRELTSLPGGRVELFDLQALRLDQIVTLAEGPVELGTESGPRLLVEVR